MLGSIIGDIIGSRFEGTCNNNVNKPNFRLFAKDCRFTDDTVLTVAVAEVLAYNIEDDWNTEDDLGYAESFRAYYNLFPNAGFGSGFKRWAMSEDDKPYYSYGNGSAMRVSPIGYACTCIDSVLQEAKKSAEVTHNHPQGIKGAQAAALSVFLAKNKYNKDEIATEIRTRFNYNLSGKYNANHLGFDVTCDGSVPLAIHSFLIGNNFEDVMRKAVLMGGDTDTIASIAGSISEAYWGIPEWIKQKAFTYLPYSFIEDVKYFYKSFS